MKDLALDNTENEQQELRVKKEPFEVTLTNLAIANLTLDNAAWQRPISETYADPPMNPLTGKAYNGANRVLLTMQEATDNRWLTVLQANQQGLGIQKESSGVPILYWQTSKNEKVLDNFGNPKLDDNGKHVTQKIHFDKLCDS